MTTRILPLGARSYLVELPALGDAMALHAQLIAHPPRGLAELVPAARTVLCRFDSQRDARAAATTLAARAQSVRAGSVRAPSAQAGSAQAGSAQAESAPGRSAGAGTHPDAPTVHLDVTYDGDDLDHVAERLGCSRDTVIRMHTGPTWVSAFMGFAPGFAYLTGGDERLHLPRRDVPRTSVPAGAVAIANGFTAVYPASSPGGWHLLGRTGSSTWDAHRTPPALLTPGTRVRFNAVRELAVAVGGAESRHGKEPAATSEPEPEPEQGRGAPPKGAPAAPSIRTDALGSPALRVEHAGGHALIEDLGRPGNAAIGVPASGAADRAEIRRANRLVGNPSSAAAIELTGIDMAGRGFVATALDDIIVAVAGADAAITIRRAPAVARAVPPDNVDASATADSNSNSNGTGAPSPVTSSNADWGAWAEWDAEGNEIGPRPAEQGGSGPGSHHRDDRAAAPRKEDAEPGEPILLRGGDELHVAPDVSRGAWRVMLALRGGVAAPAVLGSKSRDELSRLGPDALAAGDIVAIEPPSVAAIGWPELDPPVPSASETDPLVLALEPGPRLDHLTERSRTLLTELVWRIRSDSNRVGVRLEPADPTSSTLEHEATKELASEGAVPGAVQVPPGGAPVVFGRDHPVTGGYPVVGVVAPLDLDALARLAPGRCVQFAWSAVPREAE